jgi:hypothetical protein
MFKIGSIAFGAALVLASASGAQLPADPGQSISFQLPEPGSIEVYTSGQPDAPPEPRAMPKQSLLNVDAVQVEIVMTDAQRQKQAAIFAHYRDRTRKANAEYRDRTRKANDEPRARLEFDATLKAVANQLITDLQANLDPGQWSRLDHVHLQSAGPLAFLLPETQKRLEMSEVQVKQVQVIVDEGWMEMQAARIVPLVLKDDEKPKGVEGIPRLLKKREVQAAIQNGRQASRKARAAVIERIGKVLTERQKAAYQSLLAPPFDVERLRPFDNDSAVRAVALSLGLQLGQRADPEFDTKVARPAYKTKHPKVLLDEAHFNFHTVSGRYKPFADLITSDGYQISPNRDKFTKDVLSGCDILVIANALGSEGIGSIDAAKPAFTADECDIVRDWVKSGGALLLIADHYPFGWAAEDLAKRFDVDMSKGVTVDPVNSFPSGGLLFERRKGLLGEHPITNGRDSSERVERVATFAGQSLKGPEGSVSFLIFADTAIDRLRPENKVVSAAGRSQGLAFSYGRGRVVVVGEAAQLSAQITGVSSRTGMNVPGIDNRQMCLNIIHWLSGLLN